MPLLAAECCKQSPSRDRRIVTCLQKAHATLSSPLPACCTRAGCSFACMQGAAASCELGAALLLGRGRRGAVCLCRPKAAVQGNSLARFFANCPENAFQRVPPGYAPFSVTQRAGAGGVCLWDSTCLYAVSA